VRLLAALLCASSYSQLQCDSAFSVRELLLLLPPPRTVLFFLCSSDERLTAGKCLRNVRFIATTATGRQLVRAGARHVGASTMMSIMTRAAGVQLPPV